MKIIAAFAAVVAVAASFNASAALAGPAKVEARVSYADLDLSAPAGQQTLEKRIKQAARTACGVDPDERHQVLAIDSARCYRAAVAGALAEAARINPTVVASR
jgi:UrcA family protein